MTTRITKQTATRFEEVREASTPDRLLPVTEVAKRLGTGVRFPRRLIEERRIEFVRVGRHVRIPESVLDAYIESRTVKPIPVAVRRGRCA